MKPHPPSKIVHVTECLASGTLTFLVQATRELAERGVRQTVVFSRRPDTPADVTSRFDPRVQLQELDPPSQGLWRYAQAMRATLTAHCQELEDIAIHLHSSKAGFIGRLALMGLRRRPRVFYSPHGLSFLNRRRPLASLLFASLEWLAARLPGTLVGCSRSEASILGRLSGRPARVLENAVDDSFLSLRPAPGPVPAVITMGRICEQKAPETFATLAARFKIAEVPARFIWIGEGDAGAEARLRAAGVEVTGWLEAADVRRLLEEATVYVQTSRWEGLPLSVLQALAAGVPCVVTDVVGNRDAVRQGITGFVAGTLEEMLMDVRRLLRDDVLRARFSQAARRDAKERFSQAAFADRLARLYGLPQADWAAASRSGSNLISFARLEGHLPSDNAQPALLASRA